jgi:NodT family efflux transporter outer membrane factor (OMF) lipoprotein
MARIMRLSRVIVLLAASVLASCAVGPNFKRPAPPDSPDYGTASAPIAGTTQQWKPGQDIPADWWTVFQSPQLNELITAAMTGNPDVHAAEAALRQAHELYAAQRTTLWPTAQGSFNGTRSQFAPGTLTSPTVAPSPTYNLYTATLNVSYVPDVFGGVRRAIEASHAQEQVTQFQLEAAYLTLTSNVVVTAIQEASLRGQVAATERLLELQKQVTAKVRGQQALGTASKLDLLVQQSVEAQTAATLPPLRKQLSQTRDALTALLGRLPADEPTEAFQLDELTLPTDLPVSLPSKLVEQRPDVRQAEANMHVASAEVGVSVANMLPQFLISADLGSQALRLSDLFKTGTGFWDAGASLTQTLFDAGALIHKHRAAEAALDQAADQYRSAVILAFQNVADTLHALQIDAAAVEANAAAELAARSAFELAQKQQQLGTVNLLAVLTAETAYQQATVSLIQARANQYSDTAALFQALGGGWWNRPRGRIS